MSKKILNIVRSAYRATVEEQDDTILWLCQAMKGQGAEIDVVLQGAASNYAVAHQGKNPLSIGNWTQTHPADISQDVQRLLDKGAKVFYIEEDVAHRGWERHELLPGLQGLSQETFSTLMDKYDLVWCW